MSVTSLRLKKFEKKGLVPKEVNDTVIETLKPKDRKPSGDFPSTKSVSDYAASGKLSTATRLSEKFNNSTAPQESFKTKGVSERLNSIMPIRATGMGAEDLEKVDDIKPEEIENQVESNKEKTDLMKEKIKYLKKLRG